MQKSLKKTALIVSIGTSISKFGGLIRQLVIAGIFGIGAAYDAYNYAYILPGFFLILLGGSNGPLHNSIVSILSNKSEPERRYIISSINTVTSIFLAVLALIIFTNAELIINLIGPGLNSETSKIAIFQLKIMAPIVLLSGLIGLGFGALNTAEDFIIPSISPIISSLSLILFIGTYFILKEPNTNDLNYELAGGIILAIGTVAGSFFQWIVQLPKLVKTRLLRLKPNFDLENQGVKEVLRLLIPATLSSGMLQINVFTDLFFASSISGAAAGLSYANFLVQAPLGIISNTLLIPLLPVFSKLKNNKKPFLHKIGQGISISITSMVTLGAIFIALGTPLISLVYERGAFEAQAVNVVKGLLVAYSIGMPVYLCRDLLVRVFYSIGDSKTPFIFSIIGIALNIIFDWILVGAPTKGGLLLPFNLGAIGLVIATMLVNLITCILLIYKLNYIFPDMPIQTWLKDSFKILVIGLISGTIGWGTSQYISWPNGFLGNSSQLIICSGIIILFFILIGNFFHIEEIRNLSKVIRRKLIPF